MKTGKSLGLACLLALSLVACHGSRPSAPGRSDAPGRSPRPGPSSAEVLRLGLAAEKGGRFPGSFDSLAWEGVLGLARDLGGRFVGEAGGPDYGDRVEITWLESRVGPSDHAQILESLAGSGCRLIFALGQSWADAVFQGARARPDCHFVLLDSSAGESRESPNVTRVYFPEEEASFLAGALAGAWLRKSPRARLGYIGGGDLAASRRCQAAFSGGGAYANPGLRKPGSVLSQIQAKDGPGQTGSKSVLAAATALYQAGAQIVYHAPGLGSKGLFEAARISGQLAMGSGLDEAKALGSASPEGMASDAVKAILGSTEKRPDRALSTLVEAYLQAGGLKGGFLSFGLQLGGVDLAPGGQGRDKLAPYLLELGDLQARILAGEIHVPVDDQAVQEFLRNLK